MNVSTMRLLSDCTQLGARESARDDGVHMIQQSQVSVLANARVDQRGGHDTGGRFGEGWSPLAALTAFRPFSVPRIISAAIGIMTTCSPGPPLLSRAPKIPERSQLAGARERQRFHLVLKCHYSSPSPGLWMLRSIFGGNLFRPIPP